MLSVPISQVMPGMVAARAVCHSRNGVHYIQSGYELDARTIARLAGLGVQSLWIECGDLPEVNEKINERVIARQEEMVVSLAKTVEMLRTRTDAGIDCAVLDDKVGTLLSEILEDPHHQPLLANMAGDCGAMVRHLTNCCYVCLLLGTHLSGYVRHQRRKLPPRMAEDLRQLGMGAFIHDLGKVCLPAEAQDTHILNADPYDAVYRAHTTGGREVLRGQVQASAAYMVVHHHQRYDGQGFPKVRSRNPIDPVQPLCGDKIHIFARILAVADAFDHLLGTREKPRPTIQALYDLQQPQFEGWFDPIILAALNHLMPPFMLGSVVTLTDRTCAVVVENHADAPCQPTVRILFGEPGAPGCTVAENSVDLRRHDDLNVREVDGVDVTPYFFNPPSIPEGVMAYWGLRRRALGSVNVDPSAIVAAEEPVSSTPD